MAINLQIREFENELGKLIEGSHLPSSILLLEFQKYTRRLEIINEQAIQREIQEELNNKKENEIKGNEQNIEK